MTHKIRRSFVGMTALLLINAVAFISTGCSTAPKVKNRPAFVASAWTATTWFENNVTGLRAQMDDSAGYIIFPGMTQWGMVLAGGTVGRGIVHRPDDSQIGWAAINTGSLGLQAGVQGFKMLVVFQDAATLEKFRQNAFKGSVSGVAVLANAGGSGKAPFRNGVAIYQGANTGLMAGVNIGLDYMRYEGMDN